MIRKLFLLLVLFSAITAAHAQSGVIDSLVSLTQKGNDREKLAAYMQLGNLYRYNDPQRGLDYAAQAVSLAEKLNETESMARSYQIYAGLLFRLGNFNKAKEYFELAHAKYVITNNGKGKAETEYSIAGICYAQGNIAVAVENYLNALRYYETSKDKAGLLNIYTSLAGLYARQNSFTKSIEYNLKAIELYESSSNTLQAIVVYDQIGNAYMKQRNMAKATEFFNKSLKAYTDMRNNAGVAATLNQLGNVAVEEENFDRAIGFFQRSRDMAREMKTPYLQVINLNAMANLHVKLEQYPKAIKLYQEAIAIAKKSSMKLELEEAYQGVSEVYKITKQQGKAATFNMLSKQIKDSLYNDSALKRLSDITLQYESDKKQQQIELLSKEQQIKDAELDRERQTKKYFITIYVVIGLIFIILAFSLIQSKRYSNNLRKQRDVLEQRSIEIMEQKEKLDQLNTVKDRFFSIISHDLRNNLTTMKLYFDLISNPNYKASDQTDITRQISGSVENTIDLLENLLVWASAKIKGVPIHRQKLNMHSLAGENIGLLAGNAASKEIELTNEIEPDVTAIGDMDMINLVMRNLISNAIKFTPQNGVITVSQRIEGKECVVCVQDNGIGISPENLAKLFDQHLHPTTKGTGNEKGTGLGLMLCKDFIVQNNGRIWAESEKGKGSTFCFSLPME